MQLEEAIPERMANLLPEDVFEHLVQADHLVMSLLTQLQEGLPTIGDVERWGRSWQDWRYQHLPIIDGMISIDGFITPGEAMIEESPGEHLQLWAAFIVKVWPYARPDVVRSLELVGVKVYARQ